MPTTELPQPALGTMEIADPERGPDVISKAIEMGYRHLDTAQKYENEQIVGEGIAGADIPREELFVATKIEESNLGHDDILRTGAASRERLGVDVIDLLYVHWPAVSGEDDRYDPEDAISAFNTLIDDGVIRHVGVANFSVELFEEAAEFAAEPILANQVEMHPLLQQDELIAHAQETDTYLVAYCPVMRGTVGNVPELRAIAEKHDATPGQVSLAWLVSKENVVPIPKSSGKHLRENYQAHSLNLDDEDIERIDAIDRETRFVDGEKGPWNW